MILGLLIAGIVIYIFVKMIQKSEAGEEERKQLDIQQKYAVDQHYQEWTKELGTYLRSIVDSTLQIDASFDAKSLYSYLYEIKNREDKSDKRYEETYRILIDNHIKNLKNNLLVIFSGSEDDGIETNLNSLLLGLNIIMCINEIDHSETTEKAEETIKNAISIVINLPLMYLEQKKYGKFILGLDDPKEYQRLSDALANGGIEGLRSKLSKYTGDYETLVNEFLAQGKLLVFLKNTAWLMWYYAKQKPFDVEKFNKAIALYNKYTIKSDLPKVEVVLARVYAKNQLGGIGRARQEIKLIDNWIERNLEFSHEECILLASGLAWMGLHEIELRVLRKLVVLNVPLPADVRQRLESLESRDAL